MWPSWVPHLVKWERNGAVQLHTCLSNSPLCYSLYYTVSLGDDLTNSSNGLGPKGWNGLPAVTEHIFNNGGGTRTMSSDSPNPVNFSLLMKVFVFPSSSSQILLQWQGLQISYPFFHNTRKSVACSGHRIQCWPCIDEDGGGNHDLLMHFEGSGNFQQMPLMEYQLPVLS